jgi:hypothetical protein
MPIPRRLVYVVDRRAEVDQATSEGRSCVPPRSGREVSESAAENEPSERRRLPRATQCDIDCSRVQERAAEPSADSAEAIRAAWSAAFSHRRDTERFVDGV